MDTGWRADRTNRHAFLNGYISEVVRVNAYGYDRTEELVPCDAQRDHLTHRAVLELSAEALDFYRSNYPYLTDAASRLRGGRKCTLEAAWDDLGRLFALSASGHGAGYFDAGLGHLGDTLQSAARVYGGQDVVYNELHILEVL